MDVVLLVARLLLALVFAVAGAAKLADRAGTRRTVVAFGVPERLAGPMAIAVPVAELAIAVALLPHATAWIGALAATALLLAFLAAMILSLAHGRRPDCRCFGRLHSAPIGMSTIVLNVALLAVAAWLVWHGDPGAGFLDRIAALSPPERTVLIAGASIAGAFATFAFFLLRKLQRQERRIEELELRLDKLAGASAGSDDDPEEGLPVGTIAPSFALPSLRGDIVTLDQLLASGKPVLLIFVEPHCGPCQAMLPDIARWQRDRADALTIAVLSEGSVAENQGKSTSDGPVQVLLQAKGEVAYDYACAGSPGAVLVRTDGSIGSRIAGGADQIAQLVASVAGEAKSAAPAPKIRSLHILGRRGIGRG